MFSDAHPMRSIRGIEFVLQLGFLKCPSGCRVRGLGAARGQNEDGLHRRTQRFGPPMPGPRPVRGQRWQFHRPTRFRGRWRSVHRGLIYLRPGTGLLCRGPAGDCALSELIGADQG